MQVEVIRDRDGAAALREEWSALVDRAADPSIFLTPEWLLSWWEGFGAGLDMHLVAVRDGDRPVAVAPLARAEVRTYGRVRRAVVGWSNDFTDRFEPIVDETSSGAVAAVVDHLMADGGWEILDLHPLLESGGVTGRIVAALNSAGAGVGVARRWESPVVDLPGSFGDLVAGLSGSFRSTLRRKVRAGEQAGLTTEMRRDAAALDEAFDVAREGWAHRQGTGIGSTPATRRFYRALAGRAERRGWLRIALLRDGREAIGFEFNLMRGRDAYNLKLGYRDSRADLSPGVVLRARVMEAMIGEGARSFDLLGSAEAYKLHWTDRVVPHVRLRAFPPTVAGRFAHLCRQRLRPAARDILNRLRGSADERG